MSGRRRVAGEFHEVDTGWDWKTLANRFSQAGCSTITGPRKSYQIRELGQRYFLWWVDYGTHKGEENRKVSSEVLIETFQTDRDAEMEARKRLGF